MAVAVQVQVDIKDREAMEVEEIRGEETLELGLLVQVVVEEEEALLVVPFVTPIKELVAAAEVEELASIP